MDLAGLSTKWRRFTLSEKPRVVAARSWHVPKELYQKPAKQGSILQKEKRSILAHKLGSTSLRYGRRMCHHRHLIKKNNKYFLNNLEIYTYIFYFLKFWELKPTFHRVVLPLKRRSQDDIDDKKANT